MAFSSKGQRNGQRQKDCQQHHIGLEMVKKGNWTPLDDPDGIITLIRVKIIKIV